MKYIYIYVRCQIKLQKVAKRGDKIMVNRLDLKILIYFYIKIRA